MRIDCWNICKDVSSDTKWPLNLLVEFKFIFQQLPGNYKLFLSIPQGHIRISIWHHFIHFFSVVCVQYCNDDEDIDDNNVNNNSSNLLLSTYCVPGPVLSSWFI